MGTQVGSVDGRLRCIVRIEQPGRDGFTALLDTGFNGELLVSRSEINCLGITLLGAVEEAELAGGVRQQVEMGHCTIDWFGSKRKVEVLVAANDTERPGSSEDPAALVATALLSPHLLLIDFAARSIEIEERR